MMNTNQVMVKMVFDRWNSLIEKCDSIFNSLSDEQMEKEVAPGRNRAIYLLGHLIAVHDDMMPLLNFGDKKYPELTDLFIKSPDKKMSGNPSAQELRKMWNEQKEVFAGKFASMTPEQWFERHTAVSEDDFAKEPHRNKLNIILTRITHLAYHNGQLALI